MAVRRQITWHVRNFDTWYSEPAEKAQRFKITIPKVFVKIQSCGLIKKSTFLTYSCNKLCPFNPLVKVLPVKHFVPLKKKCTISKKAKSPWYKKQF